MLRLLLYSLRPRQWTKNLLLFAGVIFGQCLFSAPHLIRSVTAFVLFCAISGGLYLVNDIKDLSNDRAHPLKKDRPLASGRLALFPAIIASVVLIPVSLIFSFLLSASFGWVALSYVLLILCYSFFLKHLVILDVMVISMGFVLRAVAGAAVIGVTISSWLLVCTIFLALFLALNKRRHELVLLGDEAKKHRKNLMEYSPFLLDLMITMVSACTLMAYALYTTSEETIQKFGSRNLVFTLPFVIYGIFRYLYLVHQKGLGGSPEHILLKDKELVINIMLWILVSSVFIYLG
ncbi:decaprenyl-phosphate phosphoribosyltransferase [bacterium]|nr:decaprenyl-phosphate phosphoribosyltransferase [bacterium]